MDRSCTQVAPSDFSDDVHWAEKPGVESSILSLATIYIKKPGSDFGLGFLLFQRIGSARPKRKMLVRFRLRAILMIEFRAQPKLQWRIENGKK